MELTAYYLRKSRLSVDEIADLMGFSCASSLRRALRSWSGAAASNLRDSVTTRAASTPMDGMDGGDQLHRVA